MLKEDGLVDYEKYKPAFLTKIGARIAKNLQNRHDILKHFFEDVLEVKENRADLVACRMQHFLVNNLCKKFSQIAEQLKSIHLDEDCCPHCKEKIYHKA